MSLWTAFERELDAWAQAGEVATLWWRDDDAAAPTQSLERLLSLARGTPLALSVIPAAAQPALAERLGVEPAVHVLQHGYAHVNHAPAGARKSEFPPQRAPDAAEADLRRGRRRLETLFARAGRLLPVLVPPWNRIDGAVVRRLPRLGFAGISAYLARPSPMPHPGLGMSNAHADIIDWRGSRGFIGTEAALALLAGHLAARRTAGVDREEPTGLLTHHLAHDAAAWDFLAELLDRIRRHAATRWLAAAGLFAAGRGTAQTPRIAIG